MQTLDQRFRVELVKLGLLGEGAALRDKLLTDHLEDYVADLEVCERDGMYCYNVEKRLRKLFDKCGWRRLTDIDVNGFTSWRAKRKGLLAPRTLNQYQETIRAFLNWCIDSRRLAVNPLAGMGKVDVHGKQRRKRRALTLAELDRLLATCGDRALCYKVTLYAMLRRADVRALRWGDVVLDRLNPYLTTRAETSKGKRETRHPIRADIARELEAIQPADARATDPVSPAVPSMKVYKADLKRAGIEYIDEMGRQADFHSLGRMTPNTMLADSGVAPRTAMDLMRHTDVKLTMGAYVDAAMLSRRDAVESMPEIGKGRHVERADVLKMTGTDDSEVPDEKRHLKRHHDVGNGGISVGISPDGLRGTVGSAGAKDATNEDNKNPYGSSANGTTVVAVGSGSDAAGRGDENTSDNWAARTRT